MYSELYDIHCPLKKCASEIKEKIGHGLLKVWQMCVKRRIICKKYIKCKTMHAEKKYTKYKNKLTNILLYMKKSVLQ